MIDLTVIILTYNEELHLGRCIKNLENFAREIIVVDSFSTDETVRIANSLGAKIVSHEFVNQALQFNWALDNLEISTQWILRLDADEYLTDDLKCEFIERVNSIPHYVTGIYLKRRHIFLGKWMKYGTYPVKILRLFRAGMARSEESWMDEHIYLLQGSAVEFNNDFIDENLNILHWWINKHNNYAVREAIELLDIKFNFLNRANFGDSKKRNKSRVIYSHLPIFLRCFLYFFYRYFFRLGFMEGWKGLCWHFFQGLWYRILVDAKYYELLMLSDGDKSKVIGLVDVKYGIKLQ